MKNKILIICLLILMGRPVFAQPGGGGGLNIKGIYNSHLARIDKDTSFKWRLFLLGDIDRQLKITREIFKNECHATTLVSDHALYLPPFQTSFNGDRSPIKERLLIVYKGDSMLIDFLGIMPGNPGGAIGEMDSLIFKKGSYKIWSKTLHFDGIDIEYTGEIYTPFLLKKNFPAEYFLNMGEIGMTSDSGIAMVRKALNMGLNRREQVEAYSFLYRNSANPADINSALANLVMLTPMYYQFKDTIKDISPIYSVNKQQLDEFLEWMKWSKFMERPSDSHDSLWGLGVRALFRMKYLKDTSGAIKDMNRVLNALNGQFYGTYLEFTPVCYYLAWAEYHTGKHKSAYKVWQMLEKNEDFGGYNGNHTLFMNENRCFLSKVNLDSLIEKYPSDMELRFVRIFYLTDYVLGGRMEGHNVRNIGDDSRYYIPPLVGEIDSLKNKHIDKISLSYYEAYSWYAQANVLFWKTKRTSEEEENMQSMARKAYNLISTVISADTTQFMYKKLRDNIISIIAESKTEGKEMDDIYKMDWNNLPKEALIWKLKL